MPSPAKLLRDARLAAGLTQEQLAVRAGVTQPTIAALERAGSNPRFETIRRTLLATGHDLTTASRPLPAVDESQISERLRLTPQARLTTFEQSQRGLTAFVAQARRVD